MHKIISTLVAVIGIGASVILIGLGPIRSVLIGVIVFMAYWGIYGWYRLYKILQNGPIMITFNGGRAKSPPWVKRGSGHSGNGAPPQQGPPLRSPPSDYSEIERRVMEEMERIPRYEGQTGRWQGDQPIPQKGSADQFKPGIATGASMSDVQP